MMIRTSNSIMRGEPVDRGRWCRAADLYNGGMCQSGEYDGECTARAPRREYFPNNFEPLSRQVVDFVAGEKEIGPASVCSRRKATRTIKAS